MTQQQIELGNGDRFRHLATKRRWVGKQFTTHKMWLSLGLSWERLTELMSEGAPAEFLIDELSVLKTRVDVMRELLWEEGKKP